MIGFINHNEFSQHMESEFYSELISTLKQRKLSKKELAKLKMKLCSKYKLKKIPTDIQVLMHADEKDIPKINLITKPTRTLSGVAVVAVMTKPAKCPHGKCIYCPGGVKSAFGDIPQSYTGKEPATMRALRANFDPYTQVFNRLEQYIVTGHTIDKVELIIMGGTFPAFTKTYQKHFVKYLFKAMNDFSDMFYKKGKFDFVKFKKFFELPGEVGNKERTKKIHAKIRKLKGKCELEKEQKRNEKSGARCVGLTIETRPDYGLLEQGNEMLKLGCTRVEIGVQSVFDDALEKIQRGHDVKTTVKSIKTLKDLGLKINAHYMLGLPGSNEERDLEGLNALFSRSEFRPDMLKIYPCMVTKGTKLYNMWKKKQFKPITTKRAAELIMKFKASSPEYLRIMRVQRDIPTYVTEAGVDMTNLRQHIQQLMKKRKIKCNCIRCREAGRAKTIGKVSIKISEYTASAGTEFFISAEDKNKVLVGFCRMRFPLQFLRKEINPRTAIIRELHVYSPSVALGEKTKKSMQHRGFGKQLVKTAERIAKLSEKNKMLVTAGIGAREYYKTLGYKKESVYMSKKL
ncbi:MAG: tRNA uridine(34) 5-carboxymethylaminomethyl modification radical SAM/GNAT enzyme Elp3 [bacterium]|nr:tRNA uridine(34) 5-carboxymethylaminomethyl modification radical SAM/GNAT enzyme Elp3 [bacterium]